MEKKLNVSFIMLGRPFFDMELANKKKDEILSYLRSLDIKLDVYDSVVTNSSEVIEALDSKPIADLYIAFQATFTDASLALALSNNIKVPLVIWGIPNPIDYGERLKLNSLCGLNLAANALFENGKFVKYVYGEADNPKVQKKIIGFIKAMATLKNLKGKKIGLIGESPKGYYASNYDDLKVMNNFGITVEKFTLEKVFKKANDINEEDNRFIELKNEVYGKLEDIENLKQDQCIHSLKAYLAIKELIEAEDLDAVAAECWPAFLNDFGGAVCFALSRLNDEGIVAACEADINGAISMLALKELGGKSPFLMDLVTTKDDQAVFWHCGATPTCHCSKESKLKACVHPNRKVALGVDFGLAGGIATVLRFSPSIAESKYRILAEKCNALETPSIYSGCSMLAELSDLESFISKILNYGIEHHYAIAYGDYTDELKEICELIGAIHL